MSVMGLYFVVVAFGAALWLWREGVTEAPWLHEGEAPARRGGGEAPQAARAGLTIFLAVALCLFSLMSAAFFMRMGSPDWAPPPLPRILWINTALLIAGSAALEVARREARAGAAAPMRRALAAGGVASALFLAGQLWAWREMVAEGFYAAQNPANAFFFLLTGAHGLHVAGGLVALARVGASAWRRASAKVLSERIGLCALYWHFLLGVWLLLLVLLIGWADGFGAICRRILS
ncbi:MAG: cytochrome c oxidase subunit 3 [Methylocystis sp.]|uniref:cytochrome c oxidase subunit 3 n=1 Tax=Methylocystis sp. TaxID=1911079 RepID=UPI003DA32344